ncbi:MAG: DUF721 domain-containing protein [Acidobacteriota bacterium]|nr:DUF721 domain-containing protein [Acidobacteriota bacterium]MDH3528697.1 DUF721 domain-containing protein [Acidobacteriota bacterium]
MEDLFKILPGLLKSLPDSPEVREAVVFAVWRRAAGEGLNDHTAPLEVSGKRLSVAVPDKTWKRNLESMAPQLLFRLNALLGGYKIDFIEFRIDEAAAEQETAGKRTDKNLEGADPASLPPALLEKANTIKDLELRSTFLESAGIYLRMRDLRNRN